MPYPAGLLILLPLLAFLPIIWDIDGVWYSMPVSDFSAAVIAGVVLMRYMNKLKRMHKENEKLRNQGVKEVKELRS